MPDPAITPHSHHHNHIPDTSNDIQPPLFDSSNVGYGLGYDYSSPYMSRGLGRRRFYGPGYDMSDPYQRKIAKRRKIVFIVVPVIMVSIFALIAGLLAWHFNQASKQAQEDAYNNHNWPN
jgi:hypothetical protein